MPTELPLDALEMALQVHWHNRQGCMLRSATSPRSRTSRLVTVTTPSDSDRCRTTDRALNPGRFRPLAGVIWTSGPAT